MESKDLRPIPLHRPSLHIDAANLQPIILGDEGQLTSPISAATTTSPVTPGVPRPPSSGSETAEDEEKDPSYGPQRSTSTAGSKGEREKRKRSRVTPEQLVHLERFFAMDRSPPAARRREISELLGMQERQTQIWFQNRRAKAKLLESKPTPSKGHADTPPATPPELSIDGDLQLLIHEDEAVTIIPCTDLSVGTWRRIATAVGRHDLIAYASFARHCLIWFVQSGGHGFKMEIPFSTIIDTQLASATPGYLLGTFVLSRPPTFYLEQSASPRPDGTPVRYWKRCTDWTEGFQASKVLRHELVGAAMQLSHFITSLERNTYQAEIGMHSPSPPTPMEIPTAPPMAALGADFSVVERESSPPPASRKRFSAPGPLDQTDRWTALARPPPHTAPVGSFPSSVQRGMPVGVHGYDEYEHQMVTAPLPQEYSVPISQSLTSRPPFSGLQRTYSDNSSHYSTNSDAMQRQYSANYTYETPLLTTPYHPPSHVPEPVVNMASGTNYESSF